LGFPLSNGIVGSFEVCGRLLLGEPTLAFGIYRRIGTAQDLGLVLAAEAKEPRAGANEDRSGVIEGSRSF
jgi:hypothetical protein